MLTGIALAGCGGGGKGAPMLPAAPSPTSSASGSQGAAKTHATIVVTIPKATPTPAAARRPAYVSPATQSMTVTIMQGSTQVSTQTVGLTASSTGCTSSLAGITCTLTLNLNAGSYTASISTYDGANATGNELSTAQDVSFTVVANQNNIVPLSLSGVPANILALAGTAADTVYIVAQDADGNFIVGSGAPTITVAPSPSSQTAVATVTGPTSSAPNTVSFTAGSKFGSETFSATASYPSGQTNACALSGAVCSLATPITVDNSAGTLFTDNYYGDNMLGYSLPFSSSTQSPSATIGGLTEYPYWGIAVNSSGTVFGWGYEDPAALVVSSPPYTSSTVDSDTGFYEAYYYGAADSNGDVFIPNFPSGGTGAIGIIKPPYSGAATELTSGIDDPYGAAVDSSNNLYVANGGNSTVTVYASPYTSASATVATSSDPYGVVISGGKMFVTEYDEIDVFTLPVTSSSTPAATLSMTGLSYGEAALDPHGNLWVGCYSSCVTAMYGDVYEFTTPFSNGQTPAVTLTMPAGSGSTSYDPTGIGFDGAGNMYVNNARGGYDGGLLEYTGTITSSSTPVYAIETTSLYYPWGIVIAPGGITVTL